MHKAIHTSRTSRLAVGLGLALSLILTGCATETDTAKPAEPEKRPTAEAAKFYPKGDAKKNLPFFRASLENYAAGKGKITGQPISQTLIDGGFSKKNMQLSFDTSKTQLPADSIYVSVRFGKSCLVGQVRNEERTVFAEVMPTLGPDKRTCLIGATRTIDW